VIAAVAMDVDGVLTDGTVLLDDQGRETKRLCFVDIMGVSLGIRAGLKFALVSGEGGSVLEHVAAKLHVRDVYPGCKDKAAAVREFAAHHDIPLENVCFIGDDVNDLPAFEICGLSAAPCSAHESALSTAQVTTAHAGGAGAVREIVDMLLSEWQSAGTGSNIPTRGDGSL
jgi:3-deoxy-D-manno-octulosonate 8-phosphate phosphatase (KDO 8-P phosphatase)